MLRTPTSTTERVRRGHRGDPFPVRRRSTRGVGTPGSHCSASAWRSVPQYRWCQPAWRRQGLTRGAGDCSRVARQGARHSSGATLYRYTPDGTAGKATCTGGCASLWPPLTVPAGTTAPKGGPGVGKLGTTAAAHGVRWSPTTACRSTLRAGLGHQHPGPGHRGIWFVVHRRRRRRHADHRKGAVVGTEHGEASGGLGGQEAAEHEQALGGATEGQLDLLGEEEEAVQR